MEATVVSQTIYSDRFDPMNDVLRGIEQLVIEKGDSLIVITPILGKVFVSLVSKGYLQGVSKIIKRVNIPDDLVEKALLEINTQGQLSQQLQQMNIENQLSMTTPRDLDIQSILFQQVDKYLLK